MCASGWPVRDRWWRADLLILFRRSVGIRADTAGIESEIPYPLSRAVIGIEGALQRKGLDGEADVAELRPALARARPGESDSQRALAAARKLQHDVQVITVASFPADLGQRDQDEHPYYLEVFGEAEDLPRRETARLRRTGTTWSGRGAGLAC
jgi:hypothetical protein